MCWIFGPRFGLFSRSKRFVLGLITYLNPLIQDDIAKHMGRNETFVPEFDFEAWKAKHIAFAQAKVPSWVNEIKVQYGQPSTKYACVG